MLAIGCGRIGYDPLDLHAGEDGSGDRDADGGSDSNRDGGDGARDTGPDGDASSVADLDAVSDADASRDASDADAIVHAGPDATAPPPGLTRFARAGNERSGEIVLLDSGDLIVGAIFRRDAERHAADEQGRLQRISSRGRTEKRSTASRSIRSASHTVRLRVGRRDVRGIRILVFRRARRRAGADGSRLRPVEAGASGAPHVPRASSRCSDRFARVNRVIALALLAIGCGRIGYERHDADAADGDAGDADTSDANDADAILDAAPDADAALPTTGVVRLGGPGEEGCGELALLPDGDLVIAGSFQGPTSIGRFELTSAGGSDVFVARVSPDGDVAWAYRIGSALDDGLSHMEMHTSGDVLVSMMIRGAVDGLVTGHAPMSSADVLLVRVAPDGTLVWASSLGCDGVCIGYGVGIDGDAGYVAGTLVGTVRIGGVLHTSILEDGYVARLSMLDGTFTRLATFGGAGRDTAWDVAAASGHAIASLVLDGDATIDGVFHPSQGGNDGLVLSFDAAGAIEWQRSIASTGYDFVEGAAIDASGDVIVAGTIGGAADLGGGIRGTTAGSDVFLARYDVLGGHVFSTTFGGSGDDSLLDLAFAPDGTILVTGDVTPGGAPATVPFDVSGSHDGYLATYRANGPPLSAEQLAGTGHDWIGGLAVAPEGVVYACAGSDSPAITFAGVTSETLGGSDVILLRLAPD